MHDITTPRLVLRAFTLEMARAAQRDRDELARLVGARIPDDWPQGDFAEIIPILVGVLERYPAAVERTRLIIERAAQTIVGDIGLIQKADDVWEIGYALLPAYRRQGYTFEAASALVDWARQQPGEHRITAECAEDNLGSVRILEKLGMQRVGQEGTLIRWKLPPR